MTMSNHEHQGAGPFSGAAQEQRPHTAPSPRVNDPVCGMAVEPHTTRHLATHEGHTYYFCANACRERFLSSPGRYLARDGDRQQPAPPGAIYTCPMHPQIRQVGPGVCPICGMALEPVDVEAQAGPNPELIDMRRRLRIGLVLAAPVAALEMGGHLTNLHMLLGQDFANWLQLLLATPVVLWAGRPFFVRGWASLQTRSLNMFTLI